MRLFIIESCREPAARREELSHSGRRSSAEQRTGGECRLLAQLQTLVESGNTVLVVEHDMDVITACDWIIDIGPGAGDEGGKVVAFGSPEQLANNEVSRTAPYLAAHLGVS
jgi:energy-coupling factor transporter ATP-binding protein EcfA2